MGSEFSFDSFNASDFKLIKEMTKEEILDEICKGQRDQLQMMEIEQLKSVLIDYRIGLFRKRLIGESGFDEHE